MTPTTRYAANCTGACTPGALVLPAMAASGLASISVPLVAPETEFTPRINQFDFSVSKSIEFGAFRVTPKLDLFNALNSDDYTARGDDAVRRRDLHASLGRFCRAASSASARTCAGKQAEVLEVLRS